MTEVPALEAAGLSKKYRRKWGLQDCTFAVPPGRIAALVGPNGAGKSTLLRMAAGLSRPTAGSVRLFGRRATEQSSEVLQSMAYLDQERPLYKSWRVDEMLHFGRNLNPRWDDAVAHSHLDELGIDLRARVGTLSVGQQAQVALTICLAKQADLLLLDEPAAALDPLARSQLMAMLLGSVVDRGVTVLLSSHAVAELESICDFVVILSQSRVQLADELDRVMAEHRVLTGVRREPASVPSRLKLIHATATERQSSWLVRSADPVVDPTWEVHEPTLEEVVLGYLQAGMSRPAGDLPRQPAAKASA